MGAPTKAERARIAERRATAIQLRLAGMDWQTIADRLGYASRGAAHTDVSRAMEQHLKEEAEQVDLMRHTETQRLDRLQAAHWPKALKGDKTSSDIVLKCIAQRARLQGTEAPTRVNVQAEQLGAEILDLLGQATGQADEQGDDQPSI